MLEAMVIGEISQLFHRHPTLAAVQFKDIAAHIDAEVQLKVNLIWTGNHQPEEALVRQVKSEAIAALWRCGDTGVPGFSKLLRTYHVDEPGMEAHCARSRAMQSKNHLEKLYQPGIKGGPR